MRIALCNGYEMKISENRKIRIADEAGRGAGCIVYDAIYWDQMQIKHKIRVRECYPAYIQLTENAVCCLLEIQKNLKKQKTALQMRIKEIRISEIR